MLRTLREHGIDPRGWASAEYGQNQDTVALLIEAGLAYHCDWSSDDRPFRVRTVTDELIWTVPNAAQYDDSFVIEQRGLPSHAYYSSLVTAADWLVAEAGRTGRRSLTANLRPYLTGQPFRASYFEDTLKALRDRDLVGAYSPERLVREIDPSALRTDNS